MTSATLNLIQANNCDSYTLKVNEVPTYIKRVENEMFTCRMLRNEINEKKCQKWLNILGFCTLIIKKGMFTEHFEKVDKLKHRINSIYDVLLNKRLGFIDFQKLEREEKRQRMKINQNIDEEDSYYYSD